MRDRKKHVCAIPVLFNSLQTFARMKKVKKRYITVEEREGWVLPHQLGNVSFLPLLSLHKILKYCQQKLEFTMEKDYRFIM